MNFVRFAFGGNKLRVKFGAQYHSTQHVRAYTYTKGSAESKENETKEKTVMINVRSKDRKLRVMGRGRWVGKKATKKNKCAPVQRRPFLIRLVHLIQTFPRWKRRSFCRPSNSCHSSGRKRGGRSLGRAMRRGHTKTAQTCLPSKETNRVRDKVTLKILSKQTKGMGWVLVRLEWKKREHGKTRSLQITSDM